MFNFPDKGRIFKSQRDLWHCSKIIKNKIELAGKRSYIRKLNCFHFLRMVKFYEVSNRVVIINHCVPIKLTV